jgi:hypothetical protein
MLTISSCCSHPDALLSCEPKMNQGRAWGCGQGSPAPPSQSRYWPGTTRLLCIDGVLQTLAIPRPVWRGWYVPLHASLACTVGLIMLTRCRCLLARRSRRAGICLALAVWLGQPGSRPCNPNFTIRSIAPLWATQPIQPIQPSQPGDPGEFQGTDRTLELVCAPSNLVHAPCLSLPLHPPRQAQPISGQPSQVSCALATTTQHSPACNAIQRPKQFPNSYSIGSLQRPWPTQNPAIAPEEHAAIDVAVELLPIPSSPIELPLPTAPLPARAALAALLPSCLAPHSHHCLPAPAPAPALFTIRSHNSRPLFPPHKVARPPETS